MERYWYNIGGFMLGRGFKLPIAVGCFGISFSIPLEWGYDTVLTLFGIVALIWFMSRCPRIGLDVRDVTECRKALQFVNMKVPAEDVWKQSERERCADDAVMRIALLKKKCRRSDVWCPEAMSRMCSFHVWLMFLDGLEVAIRDSGVHGARAWGAHCSGIEQCDMWDPNAVLDYVKPGVRWRAYTFLCPSVLKD